ncbi:Aste57867_15379 [Aphanomyces stellatus]|uniref:peptidyl-tRNA hydrolase n=1 Tax=Aphanomyces stellatus TaxID=120398 RepID=A0A485L305_9STRA|nr:hypothetical protein As57867_015323 [Aphanomyces stellatus]VFT92185.1 Aste57867_15379 [Aphanomyces stellatus]
MVRKHKTTLAVAVDDDEKRGVTPSPKPKKRTKTSASEAHCEIDDSEPLKMVLVIRTDLNMSVGKVGAQCGHATLGAYKLAVKRTERTVASWEASGQAKIVLRVDSEADLLHLATQAQGAKLVHYIVVDAGRTEIAPDTKTVLAIGPAARSAIDKITGHLKLM